MESLDLVVLCVAFFIFAIALLIYVHRRSSSAFDEQDSLLPKFAGLLLSPWRKVTTGQNNEPKMMRPVRQKLRSSSLPTSLPIGTRKETAEVPIKKIHVPYFFPLLDETAEWWQMHQSTVTERQLAPKQEAGEGLEDDLSFSDRKTEI
ncbi:unnamed protein product [Peronospora destructor]|uniref:Uncharacterized protein n=1 Tax=Peronospora destructor TaxID=86335 RepID=A0AAV0UWE1_9STRA|nr:unnamed protein product [Peronospora destructor]